MATQLIPLFPLSLVLLPAMPLPLHIFEERYKEMMSDIISSEGEFGVVLVKDEGIVNIGCTASVVNVMHKYPDGRMDLIAAGQRRFTIESLDEDKSYLRAHVTFFEDEDMRSIPTDLQFRADATYRKLMAVERPSVKPDTAAGSARLSFQIGQLISDVDKRQTVLSLRSEVERLEYLVKIVPEYLFQRQQTALAKRVGPLNGHAKHVTEA
ncbi:MAG TPA: LON peptidase substrate-binding domain-containing protein [Bryobacteraceae bacterium]|nr:LON peptidase substrate-binding domain-containing protein [Bryobacteraceae bacterium]